MVSCDTFCDLELSFTRAIQFFLFNNSTFDNNFSYLLVEHVRLLGDSVDSFSCLSFSGKFFYPAYQNNKNEKPLEVHRFTLISIDIFKFLRFRQFSHLKMRISPRNIIAATAFRHRTMAIGFLSCPTVIDCKSLSPIASLSQRLDS